VTISVFLLASSFLWHIFSEDSYSDNSTVSRKDFGHAVEVLSNYDGDTITVHIPGHKPWKERVRLIGIDTPEKDQGKWGSKARLFTKYATRGSKVYLERDVQARDKYKRLLAYVWIETKKGSLVMLNEWLLREGLAELFTFPPNVKYVDRLKDSYMEARENKAGMWGEGGLEMSPSRYRDLH